MTPDQHIALQHITLRRIVERLEPEFGQFDEMQAERNFDRGLLHLVFALRYARQGLESEDDIDRTTFLTQAQAFEREGREMARAYQARKNGMKGGKSNSQTAQAQKFWKPWQKRFRDILAEEKGIDFARAQIGRELVAAGTPRAGRTIREWCK
jgi:hypothetical protein